MSRLSPAQLEVRVLVDMAKENAASALQSIKGIDLTPQGGVAAAFILLACFIDYLGTLYAGTRSTSETFKAFIAEFMQQTHHGGGYDENHLRTDLRNSLVHNYSLENAAYSLVHGHPEVHLKLLVGNARILNLETFFEDVRQASDIYFERVDTDPQLQEKSAKRIRKTGTLGERIGWVQAN